MAVQSRFCGRCGAQLWPGAVYCGRCGASVPAQAAAAPPTYSYPQAPPQAQAVVRPFSFGQIAVAGALVVILVIVTIALSAFAALHFTAGSHSTCTVNCAPKIVTPLPEAASYTSPTFKYTVNYSSAWTVRNQDAGGVTLATKMGSVQISGMSGGQNEAILKSTVDSLPSAKWQDVTQVTTLKGAHIGDQEGVGAVYGANLVGASSTAIKVRFAVIVASGHGVTVVIVAVGPADLKGSPNGMPEGAEIDYLCDEFAWG